MKGFMTAPVTQIPPPVPRIDEEFELTLNFDEVDPIEMVIRDGHPNPEKWKFNGSRVIGIQTARFKLLHLGWNCMHFEAVNGQVPRGCTLAEGQWREAFREKYPSPCIWGKGTICFGRFEWLSPDSYDFPTLISDHERSEVWRSRFHWDGGFTNFSVKLRWLVKVVDKATYRH